MLTVAGSYSKYMYLEFTTAKADPTKPNCVPKMAKQTTAGASQTSTMVQASETTISIYRVRLEASETIIRIVLGWLKYQFRVVTPTDERNSQEVPFIPYFVLRWDSSVGNHTLPGNRLP